MTAIPRPVFNDTISSELARGRHELPRTQLDAAVKKLSKRSPHHHQLQQAQQRHYELLLQQQAQQQAQQQLAVQPAVQQPVPQTKLAPKQQVASASRDSSRLVPYSAETKPRTVHALVDICCCVISSVWAPRTYRLTLKTFVHEVLRRSRVQYPVFQVALCYIMQLKPVIERHVAAETLPEGLSCGRRVFVAALQVASKYLQDRSYNVRSWAKISGLEVADLKANELALLNALNWEMHIPYEAYLRCCQRLRITIEHAQSRTEQVQQVQQQRREQQRRESQQASVYATPTASPDTLPLPAPDTDAQSSPAANTTNTPSAPMWN